jgi:MFS family permease
MAASDTFSYASLSDSEHRTRIGRKSTLIATLMLMGLATFAVALVTYEQIGIWGAILLTVLRFGKASVSAANGAARCCCRWNGGVRTIVAASSHRGRSSACRADCFSPTSPCWR